MRYERKVAKLCHYILYGITFTSLLVLCYFLYMDEAIKQSKIRATTLIKRPEEYELELPTITICPEPGFKPSISQMYNLSKPARLLFWYKEASDGFSTNKTIQGVQKSPDHRMSSQCCILFLYFFDDVSFFSPSHHHLQLQDQIQ